METGLLVKQEKYLEAGIHIGTKMKVVDMNPFIYRTRKDGLYVLDLRKTDERIRLAAKELSRYKPEDILVIASRTYSGLAAANFCQLTGARLIKGRFIPGIFTNVQRDDFTEPKLVIVCDPKGEKQALEEAGQVGIPVIALCDTDNFAFNVDWIVPVNNKGRRSLALIFYLLAREMLMQQGKIASYDEFAYTPESFEREGLASGPEGEAGGASGAADVEEEMAGEEEAARGEE